MNRGCFEEHMAMLMSSGITYAKMKSEDAVRAEYFRLSSENAQLRAERDAADYLLAEGEAHDAADFDGEVARLKAENARMREALDAVKDYLPKRSSLPKIETRVGSLLDVIDTALEPRP